MNLSLSINLRLDIKFRLIMNLKSSETWILIVYFFQKLDPKESDSPGSVENAPADIEPKSVNSQRSNELLPLLDPENRPK